MKMFEPLDKPSAARNIIHMGAVLALGEKGTFKVRTPRVSLKQWKMFHAVIDYDGFFGAADRLHVTQSTISHAVAKLQEQLGISLLEIKGRKAQITDEGKLLLERSRDLVRRANDIEALADKLRQGWGQEIRVAMDPGFPSDVLLEALRQCSPALQKMRLSVQEVTPEGARRALQANEVELAISAQPARGFAASELIDIDHVAVAHPAHPLFSLKRGITHDDLMAHSQIAVSSLQHHGAASLHEHLPPVSGSWHVSNLERAISLVRQGLGYAWLPVYQVRQLIDAGQLRALPMAEACHCTTRLYLIAGSTVTAGSAARTFADALHSCSEHFLQAHAGRS